MKRSLLIAGLTTLTFQAYAAPAFLNEVDAHFAAWDRDHDKVLSKAEIDHGVASPKFKGPAAAAIASLRRAVHTKEYKLPPLTQEGIHKLVPKPKDRKDVPDLEEMFEAALKKIANGNPPLVGAIPPNLEDLQQGKLGDCFCLAPLGAMLASRPVEVAKMFGRTGDGGVTVTLGGGRVLTVQPPTDGERALMATTDNSGLWANCYEKAVGQMKMKKDNPEHTTELNVVTRGGSAGTMLSILTGHEIERASCAPFRDKKTTEETKQKLLEEIRRQMTTTQAAGRLICGGTASGKTAQGHKPPGIHGPHAYAVLHYDAKSDVVTLWDPHGDEYKPAEEPAGIKNGYVRSQGRMQVPLTELVQWFGGFSFETTQPLKDKDGSPPPKETTL
ncbi:C2 family cysteine protease [Prosthecobacter sp.]|uniref:C2 family cysteine protease n=1 Tax=Prosthecobacter sp. TaxID=1965333 RepID=UPI003784236A